MRSNFARLLVLATAVCLLPACHDDKKSTKIHVKMPEVKVPDIKVPDIKFPDLKFPDLKSPVEYTEESEGKFVEDTSAVIKDIPNCKDEEVFDLRLKKDQKFESTFVVAGDAIVLGKITAMTVVSVSHNLVEVKTSENGFLGIAEDQIQVCKFKAGAVVCEKVGAEQKPPTEIKPDPNAEKCEYVGHKTESNVISKGYFTLKGGGKIAATKQVKVQSAEQKCGKGQEPKVSKGQSTIKSIVIKGFNPLQINRAQCKGVVVYSFDETKDADGGREGIRKEVTAAPIE